jgi:hypothetical protein
MVEGRPALVGSMLTYKKKEKGGVGGMSTFFPMILLEMRDTSDFIPIEEQLELGWAVAFREGRKGGEWPRERDGMVVG